MYQLSQYIHHPLPYSFFLLLFSLRISFTSPIAFAIRSPNVSYSIKYHARTVLIFFLKYLSTHEYFLPVLLYLIFRLLVSFLLRRIETSSLEGSFVTSLISSRVVPIIFHHFVSLRACFIRVRYTYRTILGNPTSRGRQRKKT